MKRQLTVMCVLGAVFGATLSWAQPSGGGHPTERKGKDNPRVLSPPIVIAPIYGCGKAVGVRGFVPHAKVTVLINGVDVASAVGLDPNGVEVGLPAALAPGETVTATQEFGGTLSGPSAPVVVRDHKVDYPAGLPASKIYPPPLYQCGVATASRDHLPSSFLEFFSQPSSGSGAYALIGSRTAVTSYSAVGVAPAFSVPQAITTRYSLCSDKSPMSAEEVVQPEPATIPAPTLGDLYENQEIVVVNGLLNGAMVEVVAGASHGASSTCCSGASIRVAPPLAAGAAVSASQKLCNGGPPGGPVIVKPCAALPPPRIRDPEIGDTTIEVTDTVAGARIFVYDGALNEIGDGGGGLVALTRAVVPGDVLIVVQQLGTCASSMGWEVNAVCKAQRFVGDPSGTGLYAVGQANYSLPAVVIGGDSVRRIAHVRFPVDPLGKENQLAPWGGKFPLVVLLHGNHGIFRPPQGDDSCVNGGGWPETPNHRGYDYVLDALARSGMIAVSISANDLNCKSDRITERGSLILEHLALWKIFNDPALSDPAFGGIFHNRVDLENIGLMGHSRGGEAVVNAAQRNADPQLHIQAVLALAPTDARGFVHDRAPLLMVLPAADGDVSENDGARIYDRAKQAPPSDAFKSQLYIYGADHNQFNREWRFPDGSGANLLTRADQEVMLRAWARTYFDLWLARASSYRPVFAGDAVVTGLLNDRVFPSYEERGALLVDDHQDADPMVNTLGGALTQTFTLFKQFPFRQGGGAYNASFFHDTDGLVTTWKATKSQYTSALPGGSQDVSRFRFLSFRVTELNDRLNPVGPLSVQVGARDAAGTHLVSTSLIGTIPYPYDHGFVTDKSMLRTLRVPLNCLVPGKQALDLNKVRQVVFSTETGAGAAGYDQLSFSN